MGQRGYTGGEQYVLVPVEVAQDDGVYLVRGNTALGERLCDSLGHCGGNAELTEGLVHCGRIGVEIATCAEVEHDLVPGLGVPQQKGE